MMKHRKHSPFCIPSWSYRHAIYKHRCFIAEQLCTLNLGTWFKKLVILILLHCSSKSQTAEVQTHEPNSNFILMTTAFNLSYIRGTSLLVKICRVPSSTAPQHILCVHGQPYSQCILSDKAEDKVPPFPFFKQISAPLSFKPCRATLFPFASITFKD